MKPLSEAPAFECSVCGAPAQAGAFNCHYCGAGIATVRCSRCFLMNMADAQHCSGCGAELGLLVASEITQSQCSACQVALEAITEPAGSILNCRHCGGQFVEHALLRQLLEPPEQLGRAFADAPYRKPPPKSTLERVHYRPCVVCMQLMNRKNFGGASGVIVDVCARHGTWFDAGELAQVLEFVRSGGLVRERAREPSRPSEADTREPELGDAGHVTPRTSESLPPPAAQGSFAKDLWCFVNQVLRGHPHSPLK